MRHACWMQKTAAAVAGPIRRDCSSGMQVGPSRLPAGDLVATAGDLVATGGDLVATAGDLVATAGDLVAPGCFGRHSPKTWRSKQVLDSP
jgi:hypothetical protein